jgi:5'-methylthioadenosine phosphorylase
MSKENIEIGVIGGSGLYEIEGMEQVSEVRMDTPFGHPSDMLVVGTLAGKRVAFLPRHGRGHRILPTEVNARANIWALKKLGAKAVIAVSAVGSMKEEIEPGHVVVVDQYIDRTKGRPSTFFGNGIVAHIQFADPVCPVLSGAIADAAEAAGANTHRTGTYVCMEGPQFSTRAESMLYRSWGVDVIGMTNMPEARLAREAEMCYSTLALATDYDCWNGDHADVDINDIMRIIRENVELSKKVVAGTIERLPEMRECGCATALDFAIITDRSMIPEGVKRDLAPIIGRVIE